MEWRERARKSGRIRITYTTPQGKVIQDSSKNAFAVGASGHIYYVNDSSTGGDQYTAATGSNSNTGTTPADPMASINAVFGSYSPGAGDIIYVDTGLMRLNESDQVVETFKRNMGIELIHVSAGERYFERLSGVTDPEQKRKIIGELFVRIFEEHTGGLSDAEFLVQFARERMRGRLAGLDLARLTGGGAP